MKSCPKCTAELPDNAKFCMNCGTPMEGEHEVAASAGVTGSGSLAQQGGTSAGAGGVAVRGNIHGNIYVGPLPRDRRGELEVYCRVLAQSCGKLPMRGKDVGASDPTGTQKPLGLVNVYIDLDTRTQVTLTKAEKTESKRQRELDIGPEIRPLGALEAVNANRKIVILGDPGGGKTTFLQHLAHCLAAHLLKPKAGWLGKCLPGWVEKDDLPVLVVLRDFVRSLPEPLPPSAHPSHLMDFISARLTAQNMTFAVEIVQEALEGGRVLVLLDGLDEVPTLAQRVFVRDAVTVFCGRYPANRYLATCRILSYQPPATNDTPDLRLPGFPAFELAPFDEARIDRFIQAWYHELAVLDVVLSQDADGLARQLSEAVHRPDLWRLAPNPLLLTVMALVHAHKGRLPDARAMLYEDTVDILLWRWEQIKTGGRDETPRLRQLLLEAGRAEVDLKRTLWQVAFDAHVQTEGAGEDELADIGELKLQKALEFLKRGDSNWARQVMEAMKLRAGLLLERAPELFTFPHRTFQEYLAGAHLAAQANFAQEASRLAEIGTLWREVILLAVGRLVYISGDTDKPLALVGELCPEQPGGDELSCRKAWLAGDILREIGTQRLCDSRLGSDLLIRVRKQLALLLGCLLAPRERASIADTLARLGDHRPGVGLRPDNLPDITWCEVPAGQFIMGVNGVLNTFHKKGPPQKFIQLDAYFISRYPVTNAQYAAFINDGGYTERWRSCWTDTGWKWRAKSTKLGAFGGVFGLPNHPVVGVTWCEAVAFCTWLTEQLRSVEVIRPDQSVRLPRETEWEKAARGTDGRIYPWGKKIDSNCANYLATGINSTSAVGCFPDSSTPYGALDMIGNASEWCFTKWQLREEDYREDLDYDGMEPRVLRGGSFSSAEVNLRCTIRNWNFPLYSDGVTGFRVVLSPI